MPLYDTTVPASLANVERPVAETPRLKNRIETMTRLDLQIRVVFLEGLFEGATGHRPPASPV